MSKFAAILCLIAVVTAQVPMLACASDCQDVIVSAGADHDCHIAGHHHHHDHFHYHGCVGHSHGPCDEEGEEGGADHELIQNQVVSSVVRVELPDHDVVPTWFDVDLVTCECVTTQAALEAAHQAEPDPVPVPLPASVRLLL